MDDPVTQPIKPLRQNTLHPVLLLLNDGHGTIAQRLERELHLLVDLVSDAFARIFGVPGGFLDVRPDRLGLVT